MRFFLLLIPLMILLGCRGSLAPGGAYNSGSTNAVAVKIDYAFFVTDSAYEVAYSTINAAFQFERNNRALLWGRTKQIKRQLDLIRPQAVAANGKYLDARAVYLANPIPANLTNLQSALAEIQRLSTTITSILPKT